LSETEPSDGKVTVFVFQNVFYRGDGLLTVNTFKDLLKQKLWT